MNAVTIGVASRDETNARFLRAMAGEPQGAWRTFASVADLWRTLTPKRWGLLLALDRSVCARPRAGSDVM